MLLLCLKIFFVRILDVSLGTVRTLLTVKGKSVIASMVGFVEVSIWFLVVKEAINTTESGLFVMIAYAGGFAIGTFIGGKIANKFIKGNLGVQIITSSRDDEIIDKIRTDGYAVSVLDVKGHEEDKQKYMLFIEINKIHLSSLERLVKKLDPKAFIVVNETKYVQNGFIK